MLIIAAFVGKSFAQDNDKSDRPKITISKETTWFTEPLNEHGEVDYVEASNQHFSKGVTPRNNLANAVIKVAGISQSEPGTRLKEELNRWLGINDLPDHNECLVDFDQYAEGKLDNDDLVEAESHTFDNPWSREKNPVAAAWIDKYTPVVDWYIKQIDAKRAYFLPIVASDDHPGSLVFVDYYGANPRRIARYLRVRALMRLHQNDIDACMADLIAIRKTAALVCKGKNLIELLTGLAIQGIAAPVEMQMCFQDGVKGTHLQRYDEAIRQIQFSCDMQAIIDHHDRFLFLNSAVEVKNGDVACFEYWLASVNHEPIPPFFVKSVRRLVDWDLLLQNANSRLNNVVALLSYGTHMEKLDRLTKLEHDFLSEARAREFPERLWMLLLSTGDKKANELLNALEQQISTKTVYKQSYTAYSEKLVWEDLFKLNLALHRYRLKHGDYPETLTELQPEYAAEIPSDLFSQESLHYKKTNGHFQLYSVGRNRVDDGGDISTIHKDLGLTSDPKLWNARFDDE